MQEGKTVNEKMNAINTALNGMILPEECDGGLSAVGRCAAETPRHERNRR